MPSSALAGTSEATAAPTEGVLPRRWAWADRPRTWVILGVLVAVAVAPLAWLGPGTDLDTGAVLASGEALVSDGDYVASRSPGAPTHEAVVGLLDAAGGVLASNLGSLVAAAVATVALVRLLRGEGVPAAGLVVAVVVANPTFVIAATSTVDFCWALAGWLVAAERLRAGRPVIAGVVAALAIGARASTASLIAAVAIAELTEGPAADGVANPADLAPARSHRRRALVFAVVAAIGGAAVYLPSFLAANSSLAFAQNDVAASSLPVQIGRWGAKNLAFIGPFAAVVALACVPSLLRAVRVWRTSWLVRMAVVGLVAAEVLYLRFPWKLAHLLPALVCGAVLVGIGALCRPRPKPGLVAALVAAQLLAGAVTVVFVRPDVANDASGATIGADITAGTLVRDTRCRLADTDAWTGDGRTRLDRVWTCAKPWSTLDPDEVADAVP